MPKKRQKKTSEDPIEWAQKAFDKLKESKKTLNNLKAFEEAED